MKPPVTGICVVALAVALCLIIPLSESSAEDVLVAEVVGGSQYATLAEAVEAAPEGATVRLIADDASVSSITIGKSLTLDGQDHSFGGTILLDSAGGDGISDFDVTVEDFTFTSASTVISTVAYTAETIRGVELEVSGCSFACTGTSISVTNCTSLDISGCGFASTEASVGVDVGVSGVDCTTVYVTGCEFTGTYSASAVRVYQASATETVAAGTVTRVNASSNSISGATTGIVLGDGSAYGAAFDADVSASSGISVAISSGTSTFSTVLASGALLSSDYASDAWSISMQGGVTVTGSPGSEFTVFAVGQVTLSDFTGTVWFDASLKYGISATSSRTSWQLIVETVGMILDGTTGTGSTALTGSFYVSEDLEVGGTLSIGSSSTLTVNSGARMTGGDVTNNGTIEVYGTLANDVDNQGTINSHSGCTISGTISGNPVVNPIPAAVTTVLDATEGEFFSITISAEEGTTINGFEGPAWLTLVDGVLSGTPLAAGTYDVSVTASSSEYTLILQYRIVVAEAPEPESGWTIAMTVSVIVVIIAVLAVAVIALRWFGKM
ncbi:MAG: hypothetical protein Q4Q62_08140 [Thermoplasmata archaeon]|nr:hypothetical protein [Thermoplasmata archaeon]